MKKSLEKGDFWDLLKTLAIVLTELPPGKARDLANHANSSTGHGDVTLHTKAQFHTLFKLLDTGVDTEVQDGVLTLQDGTGQQTETGRLIAIYLNAAKGKDEFFDNAMYMVTIADWPRQHLEPEDPVYSNGESILSACSMDPSLPDHLPPAREKGILFKTHEFSLKNSGNRNLRAPKRSWKVNFKVEGGDDRVFGMWRFNLKAMYNDPSQMREALAWRLFNEISTQWQYTDVLDWPSNTRNYYRGRGTAKIPLIQNLLQHHEFKQYYLNHLEHMLDNLFNPDAITALIGQEDEGGYGIGFARPRIRNLIHRMAVLSPGASSPTTKSISTR